LHRLWRDNWRTLLSILVVLGFLMIYIVSFGILFLLTPARLASLGPVPTFEGVPKPTGNLAFIWEFARWLLEHTTLPWLTKHNRVRRSWALKYRCGEVKISDLTKIARADYMAKPEVLDAWVYRFAPRIEKALQQVDLLKQRKIYVPCPVRDILNDE